MSCILNQYYFGQFSLVLINFYIFFYQFLFIYYMCLNIISSSFFDIQFIIIIISIMLEDIFSIFLFSILFNIISPLNLLTHFSIILLKSLTFFAAVSLEVSTLRTSIISSIESDTFLIKHSLSFTIFIYLLAYILASSTLSQSILSISLFTLFLPYIDLHI